MIQEVWLLTMALKIGTDIAFGLSMENFLVSSMPLMSEVTLLSSVFYEAGGVNPAFAKLVRPEGVKISRFPTTDCIITKC